MADKKEAIQVRLPVGRLINHALFERDQFDERSKPTYKVELAFDFDDLANEFVGPDGDKYPSVLDEVAAAAEDYHDAALTFDYENRDSLSTVITPFLDGDVLSRKREQKGKPGDAYKGKIVIRANTAFNRNGVEGPGGTWAMNENSEVLEIQDQHQIYPGCYGWAVVTIAFWEEEKTGRHGVKFYLDAFQKTKDGEKLVTGSDKSTLFKPVGRQASSGEASEDGGRRRRRG